MFVDGSLISVEIDGENERRNETRVLRFFFRELGFGTEFFWYTVVRCEEGSVSSPLQKPLLLAPRSSPSFRCYFMVVGWALIFDKWFVLASILHDSSVVGG